ncbi:phosphohydrolase [Pseudoroseomonas globiformis]|uniref:Phosphohydrolase n=1 Tax=Teichococcus globiformis TaxID=2307229 RepID=A0ABV7G493_9PROT
MQERAWVRLSSGRRLNLLDPQPDAWSDADLAIGLSRTYRWGGHSSWPLPLSVAQHSLLVLALRERSGPLTPAEALRELLHDADEGLLGFDCITPLKPRLGSSYAALTRRLCRAIALRYRLPAWTNSSHATHKAADRAAAASEALHVAGWPADEVADIFAGHPVLIDDPLALVLPPGYAPWQPWAPGVAAERFLHRMAATGHLP